MVAHREHALREALEEALPVVLQGGGLAVHQLLRGDDLPAEGLGDGLVSEADAQDRDLARETFDRRKGDARRIGVARARPEDDRGGLHRLDLVERGGVVLDDLHVRAQHPQFLDDVVGEGVVVIDKKDHGGVPYKAAANVAAAKMAFDLLIVSWYSLSGSESATMPAPARITSWRPSSIIVRMTIAKFMSPV